MIRLLIAGSTRIYREGLGESLRNHALLEVCGTAANAQEIQQKVRDLQPRVLLIDTLMEAALGIVRTMSELDPNLKIVALAVADNDPEIMTWAEAGIAGFVTRDNSLNDLVAAVIASERGELSCSPRHAAALLHHVAAMATRTTAPPRASPPQLTRRQSHVLELVGSGLSNKEIARTLGIEVATVKNHVHQVLEKLEVTRRRDAAMIAHQLAVHSSREVPVTSPPAL